MFGPCPASAGPGKGLVISATNRSNQWHDLSRLPPTWTPHSRAPSIPLTDLTILHNTGLKNLLTIPVASVVLLIACRSQPPQEGIFGLIIEDLNGEQMALTQMRQHKASVLIFLSPECPLSENYTMQVTEYTNRYKGDDIIFYNVFPGRFYSREEIASFTNEFRLDNPTLLDPDYLLTKYVNATITPEAFLLDESGAILYSGAIDNWAIVLGQQRREATTFYLVDAIRNHLDGEPIETASAKAVGCFIE